MKQSLYIINGGLYHKCLSLRYSGIYDSLFIRANAEEYRCNSCTIRFPVYLTVAFPVRKIYDFTSFTDQRAELDISSTHNEDIQEIIL